MSTFEQHYLRIYDKTRNTVHYYLVNDDPEMIKADLKRNNLTDKIDLLSLRFSNPITKPAKLIEMMEAMNADDDNTKENSLTFIRHETYQEFINILKG